MRAVIQTSHGEASNPGVRMGLPTGLEKVAQRVRHRLPGGPSDSYTGMLEHHPGAPVAQTAPSGGH